MKLNDQELVAKVKVKAQEERHITLEVIALLIEIYKRRIHLSLGYSSLHEFCVNELKYSDGQAYRRIKAMKLVEAMPEAADAIESGSLNLTTASQLQNVFEAKAKTESPVSQAEKEELMVKVQNQSTRQVEKILAEVAPEIILEKERVRPVGENLNKIEFYVTDEVLKEIEDLKNLTSHSNKSIKELFEYLVKRELLRRNPVQREKTSNKISDHHNKRNEMNGTNSTATASAPLGQSVNKIRSDRYIPAVVKHYVRMRDKACCAFVDPVSGRKCGSKFKLQYDHIEPYAMGGSNSADNIRILCQQHNTLMAVRTYGAEKMSRYQ